MKRMRWHIILLVQWVILVFTIEDLDFDNASMVNLSPIFYALAAALVGVLLALSLKRAHVYLITSGALASYAVLKLLHSAPDFAGPQKFVTITELVALVITVALAWPVNQSLQDFEQAVEAIALPGERPKLVPYAKVQDYLRSELRRARRHQRPISIAMITLPEPATLQATLHRAVADVQSHLIERYAQVQLGKFLAEQIRDTDTIAHHLENGCFLLVMPETEADQTTKVLERLSDAASSQVGLGFRYAIADFPATALTSEELLSRVEAKLANACPVPESIQNRAQPASMSEVPADVYPARMPTPEGGLD